MLYYKSKKLMILRCSDVACRTAYTYMLGLW